MRDRIGERLRRYQLPIWYHRAYRLPMASAGIERGIEPRRADYVAWFALESLGIEERWFRRPECVSYGALARVHDHAMLESLTTAEGLASVFAVDPSEVPVAEVMRTGRLACGATVAAACEAVATRRATINLLGGFHHATPSRAAGFCPINDIAVAVASLRVRGFGEPIAVLDLDAHPPDGLAACFAGDDTVWIGSLSGADWGPLPGVDETVLAPGTDDAGYLRALDQMLARVPEVALVFVIAGGDVLRGDSLGLLGLSLAGARERDLRIAHALRGKASVWLPGGGYHDDAWRVLAGTILALGFSSSRPIAREYDPLDVHFARIAARLGRRELGGGDDYGLADLEADLFGRGAPARRRRLLDLWTAPGVEYALSHYGILEHLSRLGYRQFRIDIEPASIGESMRLWGRAAAPPAVRAGHRDDPEYILMECVVERQRLPGGDILFINWLTLRHPLARRGRARKLLPGQDVPGLGLMREAGELMLRMAQRLDLRGVGFCPSHYHIAAPLRSHCHFVDPARQGRFEAMSRDLGELTASEVSQAMSEQRVLLDQNPYTWEATLMVHYFESNPGAHKGDGRDEASSRAHLPSGAPRGTTSDAPNDTPNGAPNGTTNGTTNGTASGATGDATSLALSWPQQVAAERERARFTLRPK